MEKINSNSNGILSVLLPSWGVADFLLPVEVGEDHNGKIDRHAADKGKLQPPHGDIFRF